MNDDIRRDAGFSEDGAYRWFLGREWDDTLPTVGWLMLNPSTAGADRDDPTVRRCIGFSRAWGYGSMFIWNVNALVATNPKQLTAHPDPVGDRNDIMLFAYAGQPPLTVCAWGNHAAPERVQKVLGLLELAGAKLAHLGLTLAGQPRHPLYLRGDTTPTDWFPQRAGKPCEVQLCSRDARYGHTTCCYRCARIMSGRSGSLIDPHHEGCTP